jgi:hypothetical protein
MRRLWPFHKGLLFVKDLGCSEKPVRADVVNLTIRQVSSVESLEAFLLHEYIRYLLVCNMSGSKETFIGIVGNCVVHVSCIDYRYPVGAIFFGDFTLPEFRGRHISPAVKSFMFEHLKKKNFKKVFISCNSENASSKASIIRAGFREANILEKLLLRLQKVFRSFSSLLFIPKPVVPPLFNNTP